MGRDATDEEWNEFIIAVNRIIDCAVIRDKLIPTMAHAAALGDSLVERSIADCETASHRLDTIVSSALEIPAVHWMEQLLRKAAQISQATKRTGGATVMSVEDVLNAAQALAPLVRQNGQIPQSMAEAKAAFGLDKLTSAKKPNEGVN